MKKQQLGKKLILKKSNVSNLESAQLLGGLCTNEHCAPNTLGCASTDGQCGSPSARCATAGASCSPTLCPTALTCRC